MKLMRYVPASLMTKSGIIKDERDTPHRQVRHRDGKLLRGGIGLMTGLGWNDRWVLLVFYELELYPCSARWRCFEGL